MVIALGVGALGIAMAYALYGKGPSKTVEKEVEKGGAFAELYQASKAKLWVDEIYDAVIIRPFKLLARGLFEVVDRLIIDTIAVNGSAMVVGLFGRVSRWFQNGQVQRYLAGLVVGGALVFAISDCRSNPGFTYELVGDRVHLTAKPGAGIVGATSKLRWDVDGDGVADNDPATGQPYSTPDLYVLFGDTGTHVTLFIDDPIKRTTLVIKRAIKLPPAPEPAAATTPTEGK